MRNGERPGAGGHGNEAAVVLPNFGNSDPELVDEVLALKKQVEQLTAMVKQATGGKA